MKQKEEGRSIFVWGEEYCPSLYCRLRSNGKWTLGFLEEAKGYLLWGNSVYEVDCS